MPIAVLSDLRYRFGVVRDQGARPTCLAFAASDAHAALRDPWAALSCEFAFYHAQRRASRSPATGAVLSAMLLTLKEDGQPIESAWPYLPSLPTDLADYSPPGTVMIFRRNGEARHEGVDEIVGYVSSNQPCLVLMTISNAFYTPNDEGIIFAPPGEQPDPTRRHAVIAVGYGLMDGVRLVLVRNSWGTLWGQAGYAWIPEPYLTPRLTGVALLTEDIDVSTEDLAA